MGFNFAPVDIDYVSHGLERKERDADGESKIKLGNELLADSTVDVLSKKSLVLIEAENCKVEDKVENEKEFSLTPSPRSF